MSQRIAPNTQRIVPNIWCDRNAEEAAAFYVAVFGEAPSMFPTVSSRVLARYPAEGLRDFQRGFAGQAVTVAVELGDYRIQLINAGSEFHPTPAISFLVTVDPRHFDGDEHAARGWINRVWTHLGEEGLVVMDIGEYPYSGLYGWIEDKYGVSWQLKLTDPATAPGGPAAPITPMLMVGSTAPDPVHGNGRDAIELYTRLLPDAGVDRVIAYPVTDRPGEDGSVLFAELRLAGQAFAVMDSGSAQEFPFTPGLSLQVDCDGQDEIDRLWNALSAVPEAEQCGWLVDRFGVSWQIVPSNMAELMQRPQAYEHMMQMKKLVIADF